MEDYFWSILLKQSYGYPTTVPPRTPNILPTDTTTEIYAGYFDMYGFLSTNFDMYGFLTTNSQDNSNITSINQNHSNNTSIYSYSNITSICQSYIYSSTISVVIYIIFALGLLSILVAIYSLYSMVRSDNVAPIYVINLLITDIFQLCCMIIPVVPNVNKNIRITFTSIYLSGLFASIYFVVCVALERYLVIAHPLWYRCRQTIKTSVAVCVLVWVLSLTYVLLYYFIAAYVVRKIIFTVLLLLPFPLLIFFLVGTLKALSASISVPSDEKRRIVGILVLVLFIHTLLFLPKIICNLDVNSNMTLADLSTVLVRLNPLADSVLYVFMRKGTVDKLLASVCCCRMDSSDISSPSV